MLLHVVCALFFSCKSIWLKFQSKELCHLPVITLFCWVNIFAMCYTWGKLFLCSPFSHLNSNWHPLLGSPKRPVWHNCSHGWIACTLSACLSVCFKEQNKFTTAILSLFNKCCGSGWASTVVETRESMCSTVPWQAGTWTGAYWAENWAGTPAPLQDGVWTEASCLGEHQKVPCITSLGISLFR